MFRLRASVLSPEPSHGLRRPLAAMRPERSPRVRTALGLCGSPSGCSHESHGKLGTTTCDIGDETRRTAEPRGPLRARVQTSSQAAPATLATSRSHEAVCRSGRAPGRDRSRRAHPASRIEPVDEIQQRDDLPCSRTIGFGQVRQAEQVFDQLPTALRKLRLLPTIGTVAARVGGAERTRSERRRVPVGFDTAVTMPTESDGRSCPQDTNFEPAEPQASSRGEPQLKLRRP